MISVHIVLTHQQHAELIRAWGAHMAAHGEQKGLSGFLRAAIAHAKARDPVSTKKVPQTTGGDRVRFELALPPELQQWTLDAQAKHKCTLGAIVIAAVQSFPPSQ